MTAAATLARLGEARVAAVLRVKDPGQTVDAIAALRAGGIEAIELTYTSPDPGAELAAAREAHGGELLLGAGTLRTTADVRSAAEAGADFLVTPHLRPDLLHAMRATGRLALPGVFTPSEVAAALDAGATAVKLFPASIGGVGHLAALRGPFPDLSVVPTGGVNLDNLEEWLAQGAFAVGVGEALCRPELIQQERWDELRELAARFAAAARRAP